MQELPRQMVRAALIAAAVGVAGLAGGGVQQAAAAGSEGLECYDRDVIVEVLRREFGETQKRADLHDGPGLVEFFANTESGSWTILLTPDEYSSCVIESGYLDPGGRSA